MGNVPSGGAGSGGTSNDAAHYKGKKYKPSKYQVDLAYNALWAAYIGNVANRWHDGAVDMDLLLLELKAKIQVEHPEFYSKLFMVVDSTSAAAAAAAADVAAVVVSSGEKKKRKVEAGPIIMHGLRIPREVVAHIVPYCDSRSSINQLELTCRGAYHVIRDRRAVTTLPWPMNCAWLSSSPGRARYIRPNTVITRDMSRFAITKSTRKTPGDGENYNNIEIWDRFHGLIGELLCRDLHLVYYYSSGVKPMFSPDGQIFIFPQFEVNDGEDWGAIDIQIAQIPSPPSSSTFCVEKGPIVVADGHFHSWVDSVKEIDSMTFVDNETIAMITRDSHNYDRSDPGISLWKVLRHDGSAGLSFSQTILEDRLESSSIITSFIWDTTSFLAILPHSPEEVDWVNHFIIHDYARNESIIKTLPEAVEEGVEEGIRGLAFSPHGQLVVIQQCTSGKNIYTFDCRVNSLGEIGEPRSLCFRSVSRCTDWVTFSADGNKIAVKSVTVGRYHLIDLLEEELFLSEQTLNEEEWSHMAWTALW